MHQPAVIPDVEGVGRIYGEIEHLLGLLDGGDIGNDACGAVCLFDLIANLQVACADAKAGNDLALLLAAVVVP